MTSVYVSREGQLCQGPIEAYERSGLDYWIVQPEMGRVVKSLDSGWLAFTEGQADWAFDGGRQRKCAAHQEDYELAMSLLGQVRSKGQDLTGSVKMSPEARHVS